MRECMDASMHLVPLRVLAARPPPTCYPSPMNARLLYRTSSILILLFALGHTFGFRQINPAWGIDSLIAAMRSTRFDAQGFSRTYFDFYSGFGLFVTAFLLLAAVLAWQLGDAPPDSRRFLRPTAWTLVLAFAASAVLGFVYFFWIPIIFSSVIALLLALAALRSTSPAFANHPHES